ncbi:MAG: guanylate kinase, partial [Lachnospiraceae bacterium]|nr:guanylate kinase [Lachnospiraceae bacterium]
FRHLIRDRSLPLKTIVSYTTRPIRVGERDGREYHFVSVPEFEKLLSEGKIIEHRVYHTVLGDWFYFTVDDGQIKEDGGNYLLIMTLFGYESIREHYGSDRVVPIYIEADDHDRLMRYINRERKQETPHYDEVCRRYLADEADYPEEDIKRLGIERRFVNDDLNKCVESIKEYIKSETR